MRENLRTGFIVTLATFLFITGATGCKKQDILDPVDVDVVKTVKETQVFKKTAYKEHFYSTLNPDEEFAKTLKGLTKVDAVYTEFGHKQVYVNADNEHFFISGFMPIPLEKGGNTDKIFNEKTGTRLIQTSKDNLDAWKEQIAVSLGVLQGTSTGKEAIKTRVILNNDDFGVAPGNTVSEKTPDGKYAINVEYIEDCDQFSYKVDEKTKEIIFTVDPVVSPIYEVSIPYGEDYEFVTEVDTGNSYFSAKIPVGYKGMYIPIDVVKNILGWECGYSPELDVAVIYTDDVYNNVETNFYLDDTVQDDTTIKDTVTPKEGAEFLDEFGKIVKLTTKVAVLDKGNVTTPVKAPTAKGITSVKGLPTYKNAFNETYYIVEGGEVFKKKLQFTDRVDYSFTAPCMPPTDGNLWTYDYSNGWFWDDTTDPNVKWGYQGTVDFNAPVPEIPNW